MVKGVEVVNNQWRHYTDISQCTLCSLKNQGYAFSRIHRGSGKKMIFIGEAPGVEEAKQHLAFVGKSGKLLDKWIEYLDIDNYVITNVVRHRPPNNRSPSDDEVNLCLPYLYQELQIENPYYIVALGRTAALALGYMNNKESMTSVLKKNGTSRRVVLYHPSYILRTGRDMTEYLDRIKRQLEEI